MRLDLLRHRLVLFHVISCNQPVDCGKNQAQQRVYSTSADQIEYHIDCRDSQHDIQSKFFVTDCQPENQSSRNTTCYPVKDRCCLICLIIGCNWLRRILNKHKIQTTLLHRYSIFSLSIPPSDVFVYVQMITYIPFQICKLFPFSKSQSALPE